MDRLFRCSSCTYSKLMAPAIVRCSLFAFDVYFCLDCHEIIFPRKLQWILYRSLFFVKSIHVMLASPIDAHNV